MPRSLDKRKVIRANADFKLEPYQKKLWNENHWALIRTINGGPNEMPWIETLLGIRGQKAHAHTATYIDGTRKFLKGRGVLKGLAESAWDNIGGTMVDKTDTIVREGGEFELRFGIVTNAQKKTARVVDVRLIRAGEELSYKD